MKDLKTCRDEIDAIDQKLIALFEERMHICEDVIKYKMAHHMEIFQSGRETEVIEKNLKRVQDKKLAPYVRNFVLQNMNLSKRYQTTFLPGEIIDLKPAKEENLIVGYQGVPGSFSYEAMESYFGDRVAFKVNYPHFEDVFKALKAHEIDYGILPLENSTTGAINDNYDFINDYGFYIVGELSLSVSQNLLGIPGSTIDDIQTVYSHSQGLLQTSQFLAKHHIAKEPYPNTVMAASYVSHLNNKHIGAIASKKAAELYGLDVLASDIHNDKSNHTRFIVIGHNLESSKQASRISTVFTLRHEVGALYEVLQIIKDHQINMVRIESRPIQSSPWEYYFYLDFDGSLHDPNVVRTIDELRACTYTFRLIGNYERKIA